MWVNFIIIAIVCVFAFLSFSGYSLAKNNTDDAPTREKLANKLSQLPYDLEKDEIPQGAMCYSQSPPEYQEQQTEYICPVCGERTFHYTGLKDALEEKGNISYLDNYRNKVKQITKIDVKLDESEFCKNCSPNIKKPKYCIIVTYGENAKPHKTCDVSLDDINLLYDFSEGKKEHSIYYAFLEMEKEKIPIEKYKARLEDLLGTKLK